VTRYKDTFQRDWHEALDLYYELDPGSHQVCAAQPAKPDLYVESVSIKSCDHDLMLCNAPHVCADSAFPSCQLRCSDATPEAAADRIA
jgi:hypothetical protein